MSSVLYHGAIIHNLSLDNLEYCTNALISVVNGVIAWVEKDVDPSLIQEIAAKHGLTIGSDSSAVEIVELEEGEFLCPGMIDTHTHAPQYPNLGLGQSYQLLDWLNHMTFPTEARFSDLDYARTVYEEVIKRNLAVGTTTACYYGSLHADATAILAEIVNTQGQRALLGKCNMNRNSPASYCETSTETSIADTKKLIAQIHALKADPLFPNEPLVKPCLTPRFAISCTDDLLEELGTLAASDPGLAIQTHMSENTSEVEKTLGLFPGCAHYTAVYEKFGLLREGTILAHCVWMSDEELDLIQHKGAGISHCPTSNFNLKSGGAKVGAMLDHGVKVGLGSDCSGGFALGILPQIRNASMLSKLIAVQATDAVADKYTNQTLPISALFHMATLGGAALCRLEDKVGNFLPGKEFDALRVRPGVSPSFFFGIGDDKQFLGDNKQRLEMSFEQWLFTGDDRDIRDVWVRGRRVGGYTK